MSILIRIDVAAGARRPCAQHARAPSDDRRLSGSFAKRFERRAHLFGEKLRLLPGREVTAFVELVVVDELGIRAFRPTPRSLIELVGEGAHGDGDLDAHRREEGKLVFPIETGRGNRRVGQPGERDVVENVVSRQAFGLPVEGAGDQLVAADVMVEEPGGEPDR